jgi:hypothetical protein
MKRVNNKWRDRLQSIYSGFREFLGYSSVYGLAERLGYGSSIEAWTANPIVEGSVLPEDYRAVTKPKPKTAVIFRRWKDTGGVIAIFPEDPGDMNPSTCSSYEHVGQHAACSPKLLLDVTVPARPRDYKCLARELRRIGYCLRIVHRLMPNYLETRTTLLYSV